MLIPFLNGQLSNFITKRGERLIMTELIKKHAHATPTGKTNADGLVNNLCFM